MTFVVGYHGHCFDGTAPAALLTRFLPEHEGRATTGTTSGSPGSPRCRRSETGRPAQWL